MSSFLSYHYNNMRRFFKNLKEYQKIGTDWVPASSIEGRGRARISFYIKNIRKNNIDSGQKKVKILFSLGKCNSVSEIFTLNELYLTIEAINDVLRYDRETKFIYLSSGKTLIIGKGRWSPDFPIYFDVPTSGDGFIFRLTTDMIKEFKNIVDEIGIIFNKKEQ